MNVWVEVQAGDWCLRIIGARLLARGTRWGNICSEKRGCICSVQILILKMGGGQSEIFTVSRRVDPTGREVPPHESKICPPIPLSCLLKLGRGAPADQGLGGPRQRAGR